LADRAIFLRAAHLRAVPVRQQVEAS
jgi:hypothetical protein